MQKNRPVHMLFAKVPPEDWQADAHVLVREQEETAQVGAELSVVSTEISDSYQSEL